MTDPGSWSVEGRRVVVTGPTSGLGLVTARELAHQGATVVLAGRSPASLRKVAGDIAASGGRFEVVEMDLASLGSVKEAAQAIEEGGPLAALVNNAGVAGVRGRTEDGFELTFGVNYVGPFLLTALLAPSLAAGGGRVVNVASNAHFQANGIDWDRVRSRTRSLTGFPEYAVSKLAMVLWSRELARRWQGRGVDVYCVHPGVVATRIWRRVPQPFRWWMQRGMAHPEEAAATQIRCAVDPGLAGQTGRYWVKEQPGEVSPVGADDDLAAELWERTWSWLSEAKVVSDGGTGRAAPG